MFPRGIIYQSSAGKQGELRLALTQKEKKRFRFMRLLGANVSSLALAFMVFFYGPSLELDMDYQAGLAEVSGGTSQETIQTPLSKPPAVDEFVVSIPTIGATAKVIKDVNPFDEDVYKAALKQGIAHAVNTGHPGEGRRVYLFAHSTNSPVNFSEYNAVFYQLRLLSEGDRIFVNFDGEVYLYRVSEKVVVDANDTNWLTGESIGEELVLQTCDPPGTTLRRLLVIAEPAS